MYLCPRCSLFLWWICIASTWTSVLSEEMNDARDSSSSGALETSSSYGSGNSHLQREHSWGDRNDAMYVSLPVTTWSILQLNESARADLCREQTLFCEKECGGTNQATLNFCNQTTMAWGCKCEHKVPDCAPYEWPMTAAECHGREDSCRAGCSDPLTQDVCFTACNRYYRCGRPGGLPSLLQTASPMELPAYDPPPSQSSQSSCSVQMLIAAGLLTLFMIY